MWLWTVSLSTTNFPSSHMPFDSTDRLVFFLQKKYWVRRREWCTVLTLFCTINIFFNGVTCSCGVVVITSALHAEGPQFDPEQEQFFFLFIRKDPIFSLKMFRITMPVDFRSDGLRDWDGAQPFSGSNWNTASDWLLVGGMTSHLCRSTNRNSFLRSPLQDVYFRKRALNNIPRVRFESTDRWDPHNSTTLKWIVVIIFIGRFFESDAIGCCCLFVLFCSWPTLRFFSLKAANYERSVEAGIRSATPLDHTGTPCHDSFIPDVRVSPQAPFSFVSFSVNGQLSSESCYRVLLGFSGLVEGSSVPDSLLPTTSSSFYVMEWDFTEFYWVFLGYTGFSWVLLGCTGFWGKIVKWNAKMGPILYCRPIELFLWVRMGFY